MSYLHAHWLGKQTLFRSFWINFVALRLAIWAFPLSLFVSAPIPVTLAGMLAVADFAVFMWQVVGLVRSAENHMLSRGGMAPTWGVYVAIAVVVFGIATQWLGLFQMTLARPESDLFSTRMDRLHASKYELSVSQDGSAMMLSGTVELGVTRALASLLDENAGIRRIELDSAGGNIYEARGLASLLLPLRLHTHVESECSSACTIIYMAGEERTLGEDAKLGFHAYRLDTDIDMPHIDVEAEQEKDRQYFIARELSEAFLARIFERDNSAIWFPKRSELEAAGITRMRDSIN